MNDLTRNNSKKNIDELFFEYGELKIKRKKLEQEFEEICNNKIEHKEKKAIKILKEISEIQKKMDNLLIENIDIKNIGNNGCKEHMFMTYKENLICAKCGLSMKEYGALPNSGMMSFMTDVAKIEDIYIGRITEKKLPVVKEMIREYVQKENSNKISSYHIIRKLEEEKRKQKVLKK